MKKPRAIKPTEKTSNTHKQKEKAGTPHPTPNPQGGDPPAPSGTGTLLRLTPPPSPHPRPAPARAPKAPAPEQASGESRSGAAAGSECKVEGRIHRALMTRGYYAFHVRGGELQPPIPTTSRFTDYLPLSGSARSDRPPVARVQPGGFGAH